MCRRTVLSGPPCAVAVACARVRPGPWPVHVDVRRARGAPRVCAVWPQWPVRRTQILIYS